MHRPLTFTLLTLLTITAHAAPPPNMTWIPPGTFNMGSDSPAAREDEKPVHAVKLDGFWLDTTPVTNAQFSEFVNATHYLTTAERVPELSEILKQLPPGTPPPPKDSLVAGSLVFTPPSHPVPLNDLTGWWTFTPGADWRHPQGPSSNIDHKENYPVVQVSWDDANAYAKWAHKRLPTEAEFEYAARGGLENKTYFWGNDPPTDSHPHCNTWQGHFPDQNTAADGYPRTSPVTAFAPNGYGLHDMAGNVWQWCADWYRPDAYTMTPAFPFSAAPQGRVSSSIIKNPQGPPDSFDPTEPTVPKRVIRGGSFLCNDCYCASYRVSAKMRTSPDSAAEHIGFRCAMTPEKP